MDLRKFLPGNDEDKVRENYWSLIIEPGWVASGMWTIEDKTAKVFVTSLPVAWEEKDELINAADSVLSAAIQGSSDEADEPSKTVFGVSGAWVQSGEIKSEYLSQIKELCTKLSLSPIGFVVIPEAISHYIKNEEGTPPSIVTVGVYKDVVEVSVFRVGKLVGTTQVSRSVNLDEDVVEGISRFVDSEPIPTRFILYNSKEGELEDARQSLIRVNWEDYTNLKLLHTPKIEILDPVKKINAVCLAGASEIAEVTSLEKVNDQSFSSFPPGKDVDAAAETAVFENYSADSPSESDSKPQKDEKMTVLDDELSNVVPAVLDEEKVVETKPKYIPNAKIVSGRIDSIKEKFGYLLVPFEKKPLYYGIIFLVVMVLLGLAYWWFIPSAFVTVYVSPQKLEERLQLTVDTQKSEVDFDNKIIPGKTKEVEVSGEKTKDTTGVKTTGDKAKGEVTLYRVGPGISVKAGTILYGPGQLKFVMDESVNVAAGSAGSPGTTKVKVSADGIGAQYNLESGTNFGVGNFSDTDIEAKNESAFSGGSSRQISAISDSDKKVLTSELTEELLEKAASLVIKDASEDDLMIKESSTLEVISETLSGKVGDEASVLKLSLDLKVTTLIVSKKALTELISRELKTKIPEGYSMPGEQIDFNFEELKDVDGDYKYTVDVVANLIPSIDIDVLGKKVRGKYIIIAREIFESEVPGFSGVEIRLKPYLPGRLKTLPHVLSNIDIDLSSEK